MDEQLGLGLAAHEVRKIGTVDAGVHVALAHPDVHVLATREALDVCAEDLVRAEEHLGVRRDAVDHLNRI